MDCNGEQPTESEKGRSRNHIIITTIPFFVVPQFSYSVRFSPTSRLLNPVFISKKG